MILEELDESNNTYLSAEPVIMVNGSWEVDQDKAPYPLNSSMFPVMADFDAWVEQLEPTACGNSSIRGV